jgi:translation initiation factor 2 subunit 1
LVRKKESLPQENDLVISTIIKVFAHGAFANLDEYEGREGFIHISEVASTWIRNIRDFVREGQKTVTKVLKVDPHKGHIDLSIRRVSEAQKKNKTQEWKRAQKAEKLLEIIAKELGKSLDEAYEAVGFRIEDHYNEIYAGFEEIAAEGEKALEGLGIPKEWIEPTVRIVSENVTVPKVDIVGYVDLRCPTPNGVDVLREALLTSMEEVSKDEGVELEVKYTKSPRFSIRVVAPDYKTAEGVLKSCAERAIVHVQEAGGTGEFIRGEKG